MEKGHVKTPMGNFLVWAGRILIVLAVWSVIIAFLNFAVMPVYTRQGTEIRVPDVLGLSLSEARQIYGRRGFKLVVDDQRYDATHPAGTILDQFPKPGGWTKRGRRIHLAVSAGMATAVVPNVIGIPRDDAIFKLQAVGLKVEDIQYAFSDAVYEGQVMAQVPEANAVVDKLTEAQVIVSLGTRPDEFIVPSVMNLPEEQAKYLIMKAGLIVGDIDYDRYSGRRRGAVMIQEPTGGTSVAMGDTVRLTINRR